MFETVEYRARWNTAKGNFVKVPPMIQPVSVDEISKRRSMVDTKTLVKPLTIKPG